MTTLTMPFNFYWPNGQPVSQKPHTSRESRVLCVLEEAVRHVERGWCQGHAAIDRNGEPVDPQDPEACAWDMIGAIDASACTHRRYHPAVGDHFLHRETVAVVWRHLRGKRGSIARNIPLLASRSPERTMVEWNDHAGRTQKDAVALLRDTIRKVEREAKR